MNTIFFQSEVEDPYMIYEKMLVNNPIYRDDENKIWAIYSYNNCKEILNNANAHIPTVNKDGLNEYGIILSDHLARLNNGLKHEIARQIAMVLFNQVKSFAISELFEKILTQEIKKGKADWVSTICKKLPLSIILKSFDFDDYDFVLAKIELLTKIMLPQKTTNQLISINAITKEIYIYTESQLLKTSLFHKEIVKIAETFKINTSEILAFMVSNLIGLFIQSYDASRGLISNSLLQVFNLNIANSELIFDENYLEKVIIETLRFDPPIHNTRRVAFENILLDNFEIKKGDQIFLVLAAANRDPEKFNNANKFDVFRPNNNESLTFGNGGHHCLAKYFSISLAGKCISCLFQNYKNVSLLTEEVTYEHLINARLPKEILIANTI